MAFAPSLDVFSTTCRKSSIYLSAHSLVIVCVGNNNLCTCPTSFVSHSIVSRIVPCDSWNASVRPSQADFNNLVAPSTVLSRSPWMRSNSPETSSRLARNSLVDSAPERKAEKAATLLLSVSSKASPKSIPESRNLINASNISSNVRTLPPSLFANLPLASERFNIIFLVAVAALEASNPAFAKAPNNAVVSLTVSPKALATGNTVPIES